MQTKSEARDETEKRCCLSQRLLGLLRELLLELLLDLPSGLLHYCHRFSFLPRFSAYISMNAQVPFPCLVTHVCDPHKLRPGQRQVTRRWKALLSLDLLQCSAAKLAVSCQTLMRAQVTHHTSSLVTAPYT